MMKIRNYVKKFINDESGFEFLQFAIIVVITVIMIPAIYSLYTAVSGKIEGATEQVNNLDSALPGGGNGN